MNIQARFFALYREMVGNAVIKVELDDGATVAQLIRKLEERFPQLKDCLKDVLIAVNSEFVAPRHKLNDGDEVALLPPLSGG